MIFKLKRQTLSLKFSYNQIEKLRIMTKAFKSITFQTINTTLIQKQFRHDLNPKNQMSRTVIINSKEKVMILLFKKNLNDRTSV